MGVANIQLNWLIEEYELWNKENGLNLGSADEHLWDERLTPAQRVWLADYCQRWETVQREADIEDAIERRAADEQRADDRLKASEDF